MTGFVAIKTALFHVSPSDIIDAHPVARNLYRKKKVRLWIKKEFDVEYITVWIEYICQNRRKLIKVSNKKFCLVKDDKHCPKPEGKCSDNGKAIRNDPRKKNHAFA